jgi:hypothetical protein
MQRLLASASRLAHLGLQLMQLSLPELNLAPGHQGALAQVALLLTRRPQFERNQTQPGPMMQR